MTQLSLGLGFASGWFVNWSYDRWRDWRLRKRQAKGNYFTITYSKGTMIFEGQISGRFLAEEIGKKLLESVDSEDESKRGD